MTTPEPYDDYDPHDNQEPSHYPLRPVDDLDVDDPLDFYDP